MVAHPLNLLSHLIVHVKQINCMIYKSYLKRAVKNIEWKWKELKNGLNNPVIDGKQH